MTNRLYKSLTWVRHLSKGHYLIQQDAKGPDIRLDSELVSVDGFWCGPLHRELGALTGFIHILVILVLMSREKHKNEHYVIQK